ncbi:MAG: methylphosphotriester-DNA--protein-cysteine methyltransferase [Saprospiraceae bacterium]|mgnify:CR=1 FL=1|jgi:methylphosphotriester-DNA--protein-cysteine methyltransferase
MQYSEMLPDDVYTRHVESYWHVASCKGTEASPLELLLPTCTFNIIVTDQPCYVKLTSESKWVSLRPGALFFGQRNCSVQIKSKRHLNLCGIRFKPFAFANIITTPVFQLNDSFIPLDKIFPINSVTCSLIQKLIETNELDNKTRLLDELMSDLFKQSSFSIDEQLRAQLNYILDRKGLVKVKDIFEEFNISKVTLHKNFINKVGLTPKKVSQIWRMNHLLQMKEEFPEENLTSLCLNAGFYDQAHFIKDFKLLFGLAPRKYFNQNIQLLKVAHMNISRRFTNQYDPKVIM